MSGGVFLGLDVGTTRTKAVLVDGDGRALATASAPTPVMRDASGDGRDRRDPAAVLDVLVALIRELGREHAIDTVRGVSLASVGEELVYLDANGQATGPVPCWYVEQAASADPLAPPHRLAGWYALRALAAAGDAVLDRAVSFTDLGSHLLQRLTDTAAPAMDLSHASRTGMLSRDAVEWSAAALAATGAGRLVPPALVHSGEELGRLSPAAASLTGIPAGIPVVAGGHDHLCAAFAAGTRETGDVFVSVGTSESQLLITAEPWETLAVREDEGVEVGFFVDGVHRYVHAAQPSGRRVAELLEAAGATSADLPALYGRMEAGAADDALAADLLTELTRQAESAAALTERLAAVARTAPERLRAGGAPVAFALWRRLREERARVPLQFVQTPELAGVGAALLAAGRGAEVAA
ncbi:FGGY family carbohydrate kinase [Leifsonia sp. F6_8S_P_1B]|uniref:FGGY family carbohydrate kinase n=1 Tax=Leifsonia williamsii TaxID=3035919 RepID=A0ABT8K7U9_9MICO|nr:FGGY family carbohydrate kinase [Leifsonia williamsii]MDN4613538.1 FGGY family carbohydrate kinase [Leifsonia williamsii]